jgi:GNAT superfamily N-acetyltransferase
MTDLPYVDLALSRRLERCEATANAAMIESRARLHGADNAAWIERNGTYAMFDGADSPLTQTFGLGLFADASDEDLNVLEAFFVSRGAPVFHEVSPLAGMETMLLLSRRGYQPIELTSVLYGPIPSIDRTSKVNVRTIDAGEEDLWSDVSAQGWSEHPELRNFLLDLGRVSAGSRGNTCFLAEEDGRAIGTGALFIHDGVALLAGASTIPEARRRGAQRALLEARLLFAKEHGCDLAMMGALPGSASQRNGERQGFRIAYTRTKWGRVSTT